MGRRVLFLSIAMGVAITSFSQNSNSESFFPLKRGNTWTYHLAGCPPEFQVKVKIEEANVPIATHEYYKMRISYGRRTIEKYIRGDEKAVYSIDKRSHVESIVLPRSGEIDQSWETPDRNWRYEIISLHDTLTTPQTLYKDLLHIRADLFEATEIEKPGIYDFFYQKGIGCIASKRNGKLMDYLIDFKLK